ncbi:NRDE family protein [Piscinibacter sp. XHJ-5]|uniref:NRDE family protein n=1 Tax=Piscinibacter sp. XHJ-5 TaxID=3037797 RepID=UPI002452981D|nr:NRDE family protein [Piscinibacter sp. XHJ-5]
MCLVALAIDHSRRFPLVVAANRDEFFSRPAARLTWWTPEAGGPAVLSGRDLESGGTWMGLTAEGRLAMVTNVRDPSRNDKAAPSRGRIVPEWLGARERSDRFWMRSALCGYNGFNLLAFDFRLGECFWGSNVSGQTVRLDRGLHGLSNAGLNTPWPKVEALKRRLREAMAETDSVDALSLRLFEALADRSEAPDELLPGTGVPLDWERRLSAAFIRIPDRGYGTRCSTLIITERVSRHLVTHVFERSFSPTGVALLRRSMLKNWPPRYTTDETKVFTPSAQEVVSESEVPVDASQPAKRMRVRSLLKPEPAKKRRRAPAL